MISRQLFSKCQLFLSVYNICAGLLIKIFHFLNMQELDPYFPECLCVQKKGLP